MLSEDTTKFALLTPQGKPGPEEAQEPSKGHTQSGGGWD